MSALISIGTGTAETMTVARARRTIDLRVDHVRDLVWVCQGLGRGLSTLNCRRRAHVGHVAPNLEQVLVLSDRAECQTPKVVTSQANRCEGHAP